MITTSPPLALACALLLSAVLAGCERDATPSQPAWPAPHGEHAAAVPAPTAVNAPAPTIGRASADATRVGGASATLRAVRTGAHAGSDRLVFEFDGSGLPAWQVEYVDRPLRDCGSGDTIPVAGDAWLQIQFTGARAHTDAGEPISGPRRRTLDQPFMLELVRTCDFEGHVTWVVGVATPNAYTPRVLAAPSRLVIDIAHAPAT